MAYEQRGISVGVCSSCGLEVFPIRALCPGCRCSRFTIRLIDSGVVESYTTVEFPPEGFFKHNLVYVTAGAVHVIASAEFQPKIGDKVMLQVYREKPVIRAFRIEDR